MVSSNLWTGIFQYKLLPDVAAVHVLCMCCACTASIPSCTILLLRTLPILFKGTTWVMCIGNTALCVCVGGLVPYSLFSFFMWPHETKQESARAKGLRKEGVEWVGREVDCCDSACSRLERGSSSRLRVKGTLSLLPPSPHHLLLDASCIAHIIDGLVVPLPWWIMFLSWR